MTNLEQFNDNELSLTVYNDESLYNMRYDRNLLFAFLNEYFIYTIEQRDELINDLDEEEEGEE